MTPLPPGLAAAIAANRFGMGAREGELAEARQEPRDWLKAQLGQPAISPAMQALPAAGEALRQTFKPSMREDTLSESDKQELAKQARQSAARALVARELHAATTPAGFTERLARFWANHFTVAPKNAIMTPIVGAYERDAIRANLDGAFADLLLSVMRHPAMLLYLDNAESIGPGSLVGRRRPRGLNENLAREVLELHTLGVDGGYDQGDVEELARALTGWTVGNRRLPIGELGEYVFAPMLHEPGKRRVLGKTYPAGGREQAEAILRDLAAHPSTARFLSAKLLRHIGGDPVDPAAIERLARVYLDTGGQLPALHAALVDETGLWSEAPRRVKQPAELLVSAARLLGVADVLGQGRVEANKVFESLGQGPYSAPSPAGWPDEDAEWLGPDAVKKRLEWAQTVASRTSMDPRRFLDAAVGEAVSTQTLETVRRAGDREQGLTLALMSPEFQRR